MKIATTFSGGFGSVEFALKYLNIPHEIVFACELEDAQRKSYINNHGLPSCKFYKDIKNLDGKIYKGEIDYLHQSPPCQSYSLAGSRGGAIDDRGGLMWEAIRVIDEVQPKMFSVENVRGLLSSNGGEDWKAILKDFNSLQRYTISWGIMNAKEQGTPQNRERVFIVGFRAKAMQFSFPKKQPLKCVLFDLLENNVDEKYFIKDILKYSAQSQGNHICQSNVFQTVNAGTNGYSMGYIDLTQVGNIDQKGHNSLWDKVYDTNGIAPTQNAKGGGGGVKTGLYVVPRGNNKGGYRKTDICPSITTSSFEHNNFIDSKKSDIRRLTPRECARVQGDFRDMFIMDGFSDTKLYEFIGNAMDISTTKNLIVKMLDHLKNINIQPPSNPTFKKSAIGNKSLFEEL